MTDWNVSEEAAQLHADSLVWDMTFPFGDYARAERKWLALERMHASGYNMVSLTVGGDRHTSGDAIHAVARERARFCERADKYVLIETAEDILCAQREGKLAVGFHFQGTNPVAQDLNMVELYYKLGIRHMLMCYNLKNPVGDGCQEITDSGLSRYGRSLIAEMHRVGMFVDVAHTGHRTAMDVFEAAEGPVIISHANARGVKDHSRNVPDEQIKACAASGGVIGVSVSVRLFAKRARLRPKRCSSTSTTLPNWLVRSTSGWRWITSTTNSIILIHGIPSTTRGRSN